jgi:hypothetical protein
MQPMYYFGLNVHKQTRSIDYHGAAIEDRSSKAVRSICLHFDA